MLSWCPICCMVLYEMREKLSNQLLNCSRVAKDCLWKILSIGEHHGSDEGCVLDCRVMNSVCPHMVGGGRLTRSLGPLALKGRLITSVRKSHHDSMAPLSKKQSLWWLDFDIWILRENKHSDHSGRQNGRTALENRLGVAQKFKHRVTMWPSRFSSRGIPKVI